MYAPGIQYRGDALIYAGAQRGKERLAEWLTGFMKDKEDLQGLDTAIAGIAAQHKDDPKFGEAFGDQLSKSAGMSLSQKRALAGQLAGYAGNQWREAQLKNMEKDNSRADSFLKLKEAAAKQRREQGEALQGFARDMGTTPEPGVWSPEMLEQTATPQGKVNWALGRNPGAVSPEMANTLIHYSMTGGRKEAANFEPSAREITLPDGRKVTGVMRGPNEFQILPEDVKPEAVEVKDADGKVVGRGLRTARGGIQFLPKETGPRMTWPVDPADKLGVGPKMTGTRAEYEAWKAEQAGAGALIPHSPAESMEPIPQRPWADARRAEDTAPPAAAAGAGGGTADAIRAAFKAGQISREEAIQRLQALGYQ